MPIATRSQLTFAPIRIIPSLRLEPERRFCLSVASEASKICLAAPRVCALTKNDASPVSAADIAVQGIVTRALRESFPFDSLIAEEDGLQLGDNEALLRSVRELAEVDAVELFGRRTARAASEGGRCWTLDPIDGTKGFLSNSGYAIGLALLGVLGRDGDCQYPTLGAVALPHERKILLGESEQQTLDTFHLDGSPLGECDGIERLGTSRSGRAMLTGDSNMKMPWLLSGTDDLSLVGRPPWTFLCCGSLVKYAAVARQKAIALVQVLGHDRRGHVWDHAAGIAIVLSSGGRVTDEGGEDIRVGVGERRQEVRVTGTARAIVATASGAEHLAFCAEVRRGLGNAGILGNA